MFPIIPFDDQLTDFLFSLLPFFPFLPSPPSPIRCLLYPPVRSPFPIPSTSLRPSPNDPYFSPFLSADPSTHSQNDTLPSFFSLLNSRSSLLSLSLCPSPPPPSLPTLQQQRNILKKLPRLFPRYLTEAARSFNHRPTISRPHDPWPPTHSLPRMPCLHQSQPSSTAEMAGRGVLISI